MAEPLSYSSLMDQDSCLGRLHEEYSRFANLQKLNSVFLRDMTAWREKMRKSLESLRRELIYFRWCMRHDLDKANPIVKSHFSKSMSYDQLLFYRDFVSYLHSHPHELGALLVSLPEVRRRPEDGSLEALYFEKENDLAECICLDIMSGDANALVLLLRIILLGAKNITRLSSKLLQTFLILTCGPSLDDLLRTSLKKLCAINQRFPDPRDATADSALLFECCNEILEAILEMLRILPLPIKQILCSLKHRCSTPDMLLEWLLSNFFLPLLLNPDEWLIVLGNPPKDELTYLTNVQAIATTLMQLVPLAQKFLQDRENGGADVESPSSNGSSNVLIQRLWDVHGDELLQLAESIVHVPEPDTRQSSAYDATIATPHLFVLHKMFLKADRESLSDELRDLIESCPPSKISCEPFVSISLPSLQSGPEQIGINPPSESLTERIEKPIRMFLLSLTHEEARILKPAIFTNAEFESPLTLRSQQLALLSEIRFRTRDAEMDSTALEACLDEISTEYKSRHCRVLEESVSSSRMLEKLCGLQDKETSMKELSRRVRAAHENLQVRDILELAKPEVENLRNDLRAVEDAVTQSWMSNTNPNNESDWDKDRFTTAFTQKLISKYRNSVVRFLNEYGIARLDFHRKFGGRVLEFTDKRIANLLVNSILLEISDVFWKRCRIEDEKFWNECGIIAERHREFESFYVSFLSAQSGHVPILSPGVVDMMIEEMKKTNEALTVGAVEEAVSNCREMLIATINGADAATGDDYLPLLCFVIVHAHPRHFPSQLQTMKAVSQRKVQDKYFIDCCVAMKALRNFAFSLMTPDEQERIYAKAEESEPNESATENGGGDQNASSLSPSSDKLPPRTTSGDFASAARGFLQAFTNRQRRNQNQNKREMPSPPTSAAPTVAETQKATTLDRVSEETEVKEREEDKGNSGAAVEEKVDEETGNEDVETNAIAVEEDDEDIQIGKVGDKMGDEVDEENQKDDGQNDEVNVEVESYGDDIHPDESTSPTNELP